jgi:hypothetical protein
MLELIFMDHPKFYYNVEDLEINMSRIKYNLATLKGEFSHEFQYLLSRCLEEEPQNRFDFKQAAAYIEKIRSKLSVAGCIRLVDEEEGEGKKKIAAKKLVDSDVNFRNLTKSIEQKLMVIPITSYADKKSEIRGIEPSKSKVQHQSTSSSLLSNVNRNR